VIRLKVRRACALIVGPLPLPSSIERLVPTLVIMVDGVRVNATNQPLVMESNLATSTSATL